MCVCMCVNVCISSFLFSQMKSYVDSEYAKHNKTPVLLFEMIMVKGKLQPGPLTTMLPFCLLDCLSRTFHGICGFAGTSFENHQYSLTSTHHILFGEWSLCWCDKSWKSNLHLILTFRKAPKSQETCQVCWKKRQDEILGLCLPLDRKKSMENNTEHARQMSFHRALASLATHSFSLYLFFFSKGEQDGKKVSSAIPFVLWSSENDNLTFINCWYQLIIALFTAIILTRISVFLYTWILKKLFLKF